MFDLIHTEANKEINEFQNYYQGFQSLRKSILLK